MSDQTNAQLGAQLEEVERLVAAFRGLCNGTDVYAVMASLDEMYSRVLSASIHDPEELERALTLMASHVRAWWIADRGGPFLPL